MSEMQQKFGPRGFTVIAINVDKKRADADRFLTQNPAGFTVVFDEAGTTPSAYGSRACRAPISWMPRARSPFVERGFLDEHKAELEQRIAALVAGGKN
jgi:hypothetical protein